MKPIPIFTAIFLGIAIAASSYAQTTAFNFQGRLNDGANPANGRYDLQFKLFDALVGGAQVGTTNDRPNLLLTNGVFSTTLDFGGSVFGGSDRFVEISVRPSGSPNAYVVLGARQQILAAPFSVRAANATQADNSFNAENAQNAVNANALGNIPAANYARLDMLNSGGFRIIGDTGLGPIAPNTRLTLSGGAPWTSNSWTASMNMQNASALGWEANASGQRFGIGQSTGGLFLFRTISGFGSTLTPAQVDLQITDNGDIVQPVERNGMAKAMLAVTANGTIARCYNGVSGVSTGNCGITVTFNGSAFYNVDFPFPVDSRFWSVTVDRSGLPATGTYAAGVRTLSSQRLEVETLFDGTRQALPFHLFVF